MKRKMQGQLKYTSFTNYRSLFHVQFLTNDTITKYMPKCLQVLMSNYLEYWWQVGKLILSMFLKATNVLFVYHMQNVVMKSIF